MYDSSDWVQSQRRYRHSPRLDPLGRAGAAASARQRDKAAVEIEAALALTVALAVAVVFDAPAWSDDSRELLLVFSIATYIGALLSPDRTFCDQLEAWLQALLGVLLVLTLFVASGLLGVWLILVIPVGLMTAILGNAIQRGLWYCG